MTNKWCRNVILILVAALSACGDDSPSGPGNVGRRIVPVTPLSIRAIVATAVPGPTVTLLDARGRPAVGVTVRFNVTQGFGTVANAAGMTGSDGQASAGSWTLGTKSMMNVVRVSSDSFLPFFFFAFADPGPPAALTLVFGNNQAGFVNGRVSSPIVRVVDSYENGVAGVGVQFTGTRGADPAPVYSTLTGSSGEARADAWILGPTAGTYSVTARSGTLNPVVVQATALDLSSIVAIHDLSTIEGRAPSLWGVAQATVWLSSTGHFIDGITWRNGEVQDQSGKYVVSDSIVTLTYSTGFVQRAAINQNSLTISRDDFYYGPSSWRYMRR